MIGRGFLFLPFGGAMNARSQYIFERTPSYSVKRTWEPL